MTTPPIWFSNSRSTFRRVIRSSSEVVKWEQIFPLFFFKQKTAYEIGLGIPAKPLFRSYNYPKKKGIKDECSRLLEASTMKSRRGFAIQRLMNAMRQAHADGWFIVFDTLTLADDRLEAFYDNPNALRDYFRDIGRMVL